MSSSIGNFALSHPLHSSQQETAIAKMSATNRQTDGPRRAAPEYGFGNLATSVDTLPIFTNPSIPHPSSSKSFCRARGAVLHEPDPWEKEEGIRSLAGRRRQSTSKGGATLLNFSGGIHWRSLKSSFEPRGRRLKNNIGTMTGIYGITLDGD